MPAEISQQGPTLTELHAEDKERESRLNKGESNTVCWDSFSKRVPQVQLYHDSACVFLCE